MAETFLERARFTVDKKSRHFRAISTKWKTRFEVARTTAAASESASRTENYECVKARQRRGGDKDRPCGVVNSGSP